MDNGEFHAEDIRQLLTELDVELQRVGGLDQHWLSDGVSQLMPPMPDDHPRSETIGPALMVSIASPEYVLSMKAMVSRKSQGDLDDAVALCGLVGITNQDQLEAVVSRYFGSRSFGAPELFFER